jgi:hypothetical protein
MNLPALLRTNLRLLAFQSTEEELQSLGPDHLKWGLFWTWIAGLGRYWDHPNPYLIQRLGLGSVVYVVIFSAFMWAILWPLRPRGHSFFRFLTFVCLVSPPALLYAIPVEKFMTLEGATRANVAFLAVVALWRLALFFRFLRVGGGLNRFRTLVGALLPMMVIIAALAFLNLERAVFNIMGGLTRATANDGAYLVILLLSLISIYAFPPFLLTYLFLSYKAWEEARRSR